MSREKTGRGESGTHSISSLKAKVGFYREFRFYSKCNGTVLNFVRQ